MAEYCDKDLKLGQLLGFDMGIWKEVLWRHRSERPTMSTDHARSRVAQRSKQGKVLRHRQGSGQKTDGKVIDLASMRKSLRPVSNHEEE
jgi:hypothetical protein